MQRLSHRTATAARPSRPDAQPIVEAEVHKEQHLTPPQEISTPRSDPTRVGREPGPPRCAAWTASTRTTFDRAAALRITLRQPSGPGEESDHVGRQAGLA